LLALTGLRNLSRQTRRGGSRHAYSLRNHFTLNNMALPNFFLSFLARPNATIT
jgi:hypothetical protein